MREGDTLPGSSIHGCERHCCKDRGMNLGSAEWEKERIFQAPRSLGFNILLLLIDQGRIWW